MLPDTKSEIANKCREILKRPGIDIEKECAYIAVQEKFGFDELRPVHGPTIPQSVRDYQRLRKTEQIKFLSATPGFFREGGDGHRFSNGIIHARALTRRNRAWLVDMKAVFDRYGDAVLSEKVQSRIYEFDDVHGNSQELAPAAVGNQSEQETSWTD